MARSMTNVAAGRVNRRFLLVALLLGILSAGFIYVRLSQSGGEESSATAVPVVVAKADIPRNTQIEAGMLEVTELPSNSVPAGALRSISAAEGKHTQSEIKAKETVLVSKIVDTEAPPDDSLAYSIKAGMRGIAISVGRVTTAGGLILPGDQVDILWIPFGESPAYVLLSNVEVTAVEQVVLAVSPSEREEPEPGVDGAAPGSEPDEDRRGRDPADETEVQPDAATITLSLSPAESKTLFCAHHQAEKNDGAIRLTVRAATDNAAVTIDAPECPAPLPDENSEGEAQ